MKSRLRKDEYKRIYERLDKVSPVDYDCGKLCGAICCTCDKDNATDDYDMGIYLLPGEDKLFTKEEDWLRWNYEMAEDYEYPDSWSGKVWFIRCKNPPLCEREMRPIQCRTYPLAPHIDEDGNLHMIINTSPLPYTCPLIEDDMKLNEDFIDVTYEAWKLLISDPLIFDLIEMDSRYRDDEQIEYKIII